MTSRRISLEVERKFSRLLTYPLTRNAGNPCFRSLEHFGKSRFRDVYFDHKHQLSSAGMWVRQRDGKWQSKIKQGGNYTNSQFRETEDPEEISNLVRNIVGRIETGVECFGLSQIADITTEREKWKADGRFNVIYDVTDFGQVGEVELEEVVSFESDIELAKRTETLDAEIVEFLRRYRWAFDCDNPVGKLSAYFARQSRFSESQQEAAQKHRG